MFKRMPFFGLLSPKSPMQGLVEHYDQISKCLDLVKEALECYVSGSGICREFEELKQEIDKIENQADKIKRRVRNHLPKSLFMAVDKTLFLNYTTQQDNVMDEAQEALRWLGMRRINIPPTYQRAFISLLEEVSEAAAQLGPALKMTVGLVHGEHLDREGCKDKYRAVRLLREKVFKSKQQLISDIYNSDMDFKDIYQLIHFVDSLNTMAKSCEQCAGTLRAMIAR
ncbi:MAG: DUF47 domain-containing protein [Desulfonatronovibrionaceae bacterium]